MIYVKSVKYSLSRTDYLHFSVACNSITSFKKLLKKINHLLCSDGGLVTKSCPTLVTPWTVACQASLSMGSSKQEYWSKLPFPSPGDLLQTQVSCTTGSFFTDWATKEVQIIYIEISSSGRGAEPPVPRCGLSTWLPSKQHSMESEGEWCPVEKSGNLCFSQLSSANISLPVRLTIRTTGKMRWKRHFSPAVFLSTAHSPSLTLRKASDKSQ